MEKLLTKRETARILGISERRFYEIEPSLVRMKRLTPVRLGKRVKYSLTNLLAELEKCRKKNCSFF